jgi:hypothetical protein
MSGVYLGTTLVGFATFRRFYYQTLGAGDGDIVTLQTYRDKLGWLTPNATTPYIISYINLALTGALVIDLPAGPNGSIVSDAWEHSITDMGQTGPDKGTGAKYLIVGPGKAESPNATGYLVFPSTTSNISLGFRALDPDPDKARQWLEKVRSVARSTMDGELPLFIPDRKRAHARLNCPPA